MLILCLINAVSWLYRTKHLYKPALNTLVNEPMSNNVHSQELFDKMAVTGPFQSLVVKKVNFCFVIVNYYLCNASFIASYSDNNKLNLN